MTRTLMHPTPGLGCPGHGGGGRRPSAEALARLSGHDDPGMFGRMFPDLPPLEVAEDKLRALAETMVAADAVDPALDNRHIPAGYTYFGQFVDHDITLDLASLNQRRRDPLGVINFRTPALDLDNVYGLGPEGSPQLYARLAGNPRVRGERLLLGHNMRIHYGSVPGHFRNDLPRSAEGMALIGDPRNDENLLVAQTHLAFLKFHNRVCDQLEADGVPREARFEQARQLVTWHYQWLVLHDWMEKLCGDGATARILADGRQFYRFRETPYMPVEFSAAAYRLGHSMVRQTYHLNRLYSPIDFPEIFRFSGLSGAIVGNLAPDDMDGGDLVRSLPSALIIDWRRFYEVDQSPGLATNLSRRIDARLAPELHELPGGGGNLALRNLQRGVQLGLPSGQDVATAMGISNPLTAAEIATGPDGDEARRQGLDAATPLWYYILKEAEVRENGERLGPVGATIVSEVLVGLVHGDRQSYLWLDGPDWQPSLPSAVPGAFTMADLIRYVDDINPIGD